MTAFETVSLIVNAALLLATAAATAVAWTMAISSGRDKIAAEGARDAAVEAQRSTATSLATANEIAQDALDAQRLTLPPSWGSPIRQPGSNSYSIQNDSGRTVILHGLESLPGGNVYVFIPPNLPTLVEHGDVVRFTAQLAGPTSPSGNSFKLRWSYEDEPHSERATTRHL